MSIHPSQTSVKTHIYLADLTHTGQIVASNVSPLGIGLIASYLLKNIDANVELFKYPHDLSEALSRKIPKVVGFANYSWNCELAYLYAEKIKEASPETVIVFGGPNYGLTDEEIQNFWSRHPLMDFYIVFEGEVAFCELMKRLEEVQFDVDQIKTSENPPGNCHFLRENKVFTGNLLPRVKDLAQLGSPYLLGLMDKFFDGVLIPMIHTTRGCPFTCAFCSEGNPYYSRVSQRFELKDELTYIAERRNNVQDLVITDANFGMFKDDAQKAYALADIQKEYSWPKRILVSTGKNQKERVIEVASILNGAISIAASLQSTDAKVLENIKRSNISASALSAIVQQSTEVDTPTYTEIILGLPGDSVQTHVQSLRDVTNAAFGIVRMYQLILLPQTELNTPESRNKYEMKTKFRINPRSFGKYKVLGKEICAIETEEICVQTKTLSYEEYFICRELDLTVEVIHNTGMFVELLGLCRWLGHHWFDFLLGFFEKRRTFNARITELYDHFTNDSQKRLWSSHDELIEDVKKNIDHYLNDPSGTNEMAISKAAAFFDLQDDFHEILFSEMENVLRSQNKLDDCLSLYLQELKIFSKLRKKDFITTSNDTNAKFHFDFQKIRTLHFNVDPKDFFLSKTIDLKFFHTDDQKQMINAYVLQYGKTVDGLGRILMRAPVKSLFRDIEIGKNIHSGLTMASFG